MEQFDIKDIQKELERKEGIENFFLNLFHNIEENEYIRVSRFYNGYPKVGYYKHINNIAGNVYESAMASDCYFNLCTTTNGKGKESDLINRYCIALDFDLKDYLGINQEQLDSVSKEQHQAYKKDMLADITERVKAINLFYHYLIDSGNGFHMYLILDKTNELDKVEEVQKALCSKLDADINAIKSTQILRIPYTYNRKNDKWFKLVKIIKDNTTHPKFRRYSINQLHSKYVLGVDRSNKKVRDVEGVIKNTITSNNIPKCIDEILTHGSEEGNRNADLQKIVITFKRKNKYINEVLEIADCWNERNIPSLPENELKFQTQYMYENLNSCSYGCQECERYGECFVSTKSDFEFDEKYNVVKYEEKLARNLTKSKSAAKSKKRGINSMESNKLLITNVLKNHNDGLYFSELVKAMSFKKKCVLSKPTMIATLKELEANKIITVTKGNTRAGEENFYKINNIRSNIDTTLRVSYLATSMCIIGAITPNELRLYYIMRRIHNKQILNGEAQGNLFTFTQTDLAKEMDTTQGNISVMINNLLDVHILDIWYRQKSKNNSFDFYTYRLNC